MLKIVFSASYFLTPRSRASPNLYFFAICTCFAAFSNPDTSTLLSSLLADFKTTSGKDEMNSILTSTLSAASDPSYRFRSWLSQS